MNDLYIGAYWGARQESPRLCADRLINCLDALRNCSEVFAEWYKKSKSRKGALTLSFDFRSPEQAQSLFETSQIKSDLDQTTIDDLGFRMSLWNGAASPRSAAISIICGVYAKNPHLRNSVVLDLPEILDLSDKDRYVSVLTSIVQAWEPDWAGVISRATRDSRPFNPAVPFIDWIFYVSRTGLASRSLPATVSTCELPGKGTVVILQDRPIDPANPTDLSIVNAVTDSLNIAG